MEVLNTIFSTFATQMRLIPPFKKIKSTCSKKYIPNPFMMFAGVLVVYESNMSAFFFAER